MIISKSRKVGAQFFILICYFLMLFLSSGQAKDFVLTFEFDPFLAQNSTEADIGSSGYLFAQESAPEQPNSEELYSKGMKAFNSGDYRGGINLLEKSIAGGLSGRNLKEAYRYLYLSYYVLNDVNKMAFYTIKYDDLDHPEYRHAMIALLCDVYTEDDSNSEDIHYEIPNSVSGGWWPHRSQRDSYDRVRAGKVRITFDKFGYETTVIEVTTKPGDIVEVKEPVVLRKSKTPIEYISAGGKVVQSSDNFPLANVEVIFDLRPAGPRIKVQSDQQGNFTATRLPKGQYLILFNCPTHVTRGLDLNLSQTETKLPTVLMYPNKQVTIKYAVTAVDGNSSFGEGDLTGEIILKAKPGYFMDEAKCGFNFVKHEITGDWFSRGNTSLPPPHMIIRQDEGELTLLASRSSIAPLGKLDWEDVRDGNRYNYMETSAPMHSEIGDVFIFNIDNGKRYAKIKILNIEQRTDTPQSMK